jgi:predicted RNase H-like HicB family nuclease
MRRFRGKSIEEVLNNLQEAVSLYYENETPDFTGKQVFFTTLEVAI